MGAYRKELFVHNILQWCDPNPLHNVLNRNADATWQSLKCIRIEVHVELRRAAFVFNSRGSMKES